MLFGIFVFSMSERQIKYIIDTNQYFLMYRPPKPPIKSTKPFPSLQIVSSNMSRLSALDNPIKIRVPRPNSEESKKQNVNRSKKSEESQTGIKNQFTTAFVTPKYLQKQGKQRKLGMSIQSSIFKIRHLSSHMKKPKQNLQPNTQTLQTQQQLQNYKSETHKKSTFFLQQKPIQFEQHNFQAHPLQHNLHYIEQKTGKLQINKQHPQSKLCIILSECIFQESIEHEITLFQLRAICDSIFYSTHAIVILKLHSDIDRDKFRENIKSLHIHHLHYIIWSEEKYISSINILTLPTSQHINNFIIVSADSNGIIDVYHNNKNAKDNTIHSQFHKKNNYLYLSLTEIEKLTKFVATLRIEKQHHKEEIPVYHQYLQQQQNYSVAYNQYDIFKVHFDRNSMVIDTTDKIMNNQQIQQKIIMAIKMQQKKLHQIARKQKTKSPQTLQKQGNPQQFCEEYKKKMVQLAKIIYSQSNQTKQSQNLLSNNFMKLKVPDQISNVMGMGCQISANTAFQVVGELLRINSINYKYIGQWRDKFC